MYQLDEIEGDIRYEVKGERLILKVKPEVFPDIPSGGGDEPGSGCNIEIIPSIKLDRILATDENVYSALSTDFRIAEELNNFLIDINGMYLRKDIDDEAAGNIAFKQKIGSSIFIDGWEGKGWEIQSTGAAILDSLRVRSDIYVGGNTGSPTFASGFTGWGWQIDTPTATGEMENLFIRKTFTAYEIVYSQIYGLGGSQVVSDINKIGRVEVMPDRYRCYMDDMDGLMLMNLRKGDGVRIQTRTGTTSIKYLFGRCIGVDSDYFDIAIPLIEGTGQPEAGDFAMRWGNNEDVNRQGLIYLTTADSGAPFIDVYDGITGVSTEGKLKARLGNLSGIRTMNGDQLSGYGAYLSGIYIENSTFYTDDGQTVDQRFVAMNGKFESEISGIKNDMSLETGNILLNSSFCRDTNYWTTEGVVHFIDVSGLYLWVDDSFYVEKTAIADIYTDKGRNVLRIRNTSIFQLNGVMNIPSRTDVSEDGYAYSFAFYVKVVRSGTLTAGFFGTSLYIEQQLSASEDYQKISKTGKWNEQGNFLLKFTGEILIYGVSLFNDALADAQIKLQTQIDQTNEYIKLLATKDYVDSETGKIYIHYDSKFQVTAEQISGISTKIDNVNQTVEAAGLIITAQGNSLTALSQKTDSLTGRVSTAESSISNNAYAITQKVSSTDYNGQTIISKVNQTASSYQIDAKNINLNGRVTFSMFDPSLQGTVNGKANSSSLGDLAYQSYVYEVDLATALASKLNGKVSAETLGSLAYASSISKNNFASSLLSEFNGKANSASLKALAYLDKVEKAELGATIVSGGHIITSLIDTDSIYANMASIGGFTIERGGISSNKYTTGLSNSQFNLYSTGTNGFLCFSASNVWAGIGLNVLPATLGGTRALLRLENNIGSAYDTNYGAFIEVRNGAKNRAIECIGGVRIKGAMSTARLIGQKTWDNTYEIINGIGYKDTFIFQPSVFRTVDLPSQAQLLDAFGQIYNDYNGNWISLTNGAYIEITVLVTRWASADIRIRGASDAPLVENNGGIWNSGVYQYGCADMGKGDVGRFAYYNGSWYLVNMSY